MRWGWRKGPRAKEFRQTLEAGRGKEVDSPLKPREGTSPAGTFTFVKLVSSDVWISRTVVISSCCFKPSLCRCITIAIGNEYRHERAFLGEIRREAKKQLQTCRHTTTRDPGP